MGTRGTPDGEIDRERSRRRTSTRWQVRASAMGLRFAGTADPVAAASLRSLALRFLCMKSRVGAGRGAIGKLVDRPTLETCAGAAATALGCVMAGTGDLETFRLLRRLRLRLDAVPGGGGAGGAAAAAANAAATGGGGPSGGVTHGAHMAVGAAIGFLFLGGGTKAFADDDASVAAVSSPSTRVGRSTPPIRDATCRRSGTSTRSPRENAPGDGRRRHQTTRVRAVLVVRVDEGADATTTATTEKRRRRRDGRGAVSPPRSVEARVGARRGG